MAGHQELGNLTVVYDANQISIEDDTDISFSEDVAARYAAYGWDVVDVDWRKSNDRPAPPTTPRTSTPSTPHSPRAGPSAPPSFASTPSSRGRGPDQEGHGQVPRLRPRRSRDPGHEAVAGLRPAKTFEVDAPVLAHARKVKVRGKAAHREWDKAYKTWRKANADGAALLDRLVKGRIARGAGQGPAHLPGRRQGHRDAGRLGKVLAMAPVMPELWGGSADLAESNNTTMEGEPSFIPKSKQTHEVEGRPLRPHLHFGIREFAMGLILNGIAPEGLTRPLRRHLPRLLRLHAGCRPPGLHPAAPGHLRLDPRLDRARETDPRTSRSSTWPACGSSLGFSVVRPADANETAAAWLAVPERAARPASPSRGRR